MPKITKKAALSFLFFVFNFALYLTFIYTNTKFTILFGSDDSILFHDLHNLYINKIIPFGSTFYILLLYLYVKFTGFTDVARLNSFVLLINAVSLAISSIFISKIVKILTKDNLASLFPTPIFLLSSSVVFTYFTRWSPYIFPLMFSILSFYYLLAYHKHGRFIDVFLSLLFVQISFLIRRIWQIYAFFIAVFISREIYKSRKYKHFFFILVSNFLLFLPWFLWRVKHLGRFFYIDEYGWIFDKGIIDVYQKTLWNPKPSFDLLTTYFSRISYPIFGISMLYVLAVSTIFLILFFAFKKKEENKIIYAEVIFLFWFFLLLPVVTTAIRPINRYSFPGFPFLVVILCTLLSLTFHIFKYRKIKLIFFLFIYIVILINSFDSTNYIFSNYESGKKNYLAFQNDASNISYVIDKNSNVLFRSYFIEHSIFRLEDKGTILNVFDLSKEDAINYLAWEGEPLKILKKYNIRYVLEYKKNNELEYGFYPWLKETYHKDPAYLEGLRTDPRVIKIYDGVTLRAYKILSN